MLVSLSHSHLHPKNHSFSFSNNSTPPSSHAPARHPHHYTISPPSHSPQPNLATLKKSCVCIDFYHPRQRRLPPCPILSTLHLTLSSVHHRRTLVILHQLNQARSYHLKRRSLILKNTVITAAPQRPHHSQEPSHRLLWDPPYYLANNQKMEEQARGDPKVGGTSPTRRRVKLNNYALACAILASTNSILLGYDIGVMSGAVLYIRETLHLSSIQEELLIGSLNIFSLIGSLLSGKTSDIIGRRYTIVLAASTFFVGALLMGFAPSYPFLMAGRAVAGIGVGYSLMIAPLYTAEISPAMTRGFLSSLPEVFITIGILLGYVVNYALSGMTSKWNWRVMLLLAVVPALAVGLGVVVMPESPRWLVMKKRLGEAKRVLVKTSASDEEAEERLGEITRDWELHGSGNSVGQGVWKELLWRPTRSTRRILVAAIGINFFMQASGNDAVIYYLPEVFKAAGIHQKKQLFTINVIMGTAKASFVMFSALFLDKFGRRPLLLVGSCGMAISLLVLGLGSKFLENPAHKPTWAVAMCVVAVCSDVSFFSIGLGPITWVYSSEIFPLRLRAQGTSMAVSVNRLVSGVVSMTFLSITKKLSFGAMFFVLSGVMVMATVFFFFVMPETKGKNLEDIGKLFEDKRTSDEGRELSEK